MHFADLIALDFGQPLESAEDYTRLLQSMPRKLESFRKKMSTVTSGRWFSWHTSAEDHEGEFWCNRMLLTWAFPHETLSPDEIAKEKTSLAELRVGENGGLRLSLQCHSWKTWYAIRILRLADAPLWSWYARSVKKVKTPNHGLQQLVKLSLDGWMEEQQLTDLVNVLLNEEAFQRVRAYAALSVKHLGEESADEHLQSFASGLWSYVLQLLSLRARTLSKHSAGVEAYAAAVPSDCQDVQCQSSCCLGFASIRLGCVD